MKNLIILDRQLLKDYGRVFYAMFRGLLMGPLCARSSGCSCILRALAASNYAARYLALLFEVRQLHYGN